MSFASKLRTVARVTYNEGLRRGFEHAITRFQELYYEQRFGIRSNGWVTSRDLGFETSACHEYRPTLYYSFRKLMKQVTIRKNKDVFIDYGCGMGRVVVMAATYPFKRVIGVEFSSELTTIACENVRQAKPKLLCSTVDIVTVDASKYELPGEVTVIYLNYPFSGEIMSAVFERIRDSIRKSPRAVTVVWNHYCKEFPSELVAPEREWLTRKFTLQLDGDRTGYVFSAGQ